MKSDQISSAYNRYGRKKNKISNKENKKDTVGCTCYDRCWNKHY